MNNLLKLLVLTVFATTPAFAEGTAPPSLTLSLSPITLTLNQSGNSLVYEQQKAKLPKGDAIIFWEHISPQLVSGSLLLETSDATVQEQVLQTKLISTSIVLESYVGKDVKVYWSNDLKDSGETLKLLSTGSPLLFQRKDQLISGEPTRILFEGQNIDFSLKPSLKIRLRSDTDATRQLNLTYLTRGFNWQANYTAEYNQKDVLRLSSWANISNHTGVDYPNATLRLLAGEQNQTSHELRSQLRMSSAAPMASDASYDDMQQQRIGYYHLYSLEQPITLISGQDTQIPLLPTANVKVKRELVLNNRITSYARSSADAPAQNPEIQLTLTNTLGQPLPAGTIRIFQKDKKNIPVFMGESRLPNLPLNEKASLTIGKAFDITTRRHMVEINKKPSASGENEIEEMTWNITLRNAGEDPVDVVIRESIYGDWTILEETLPHIKEQADLISWTIPVLPGGESSLIWKIETQ